MDKRLRLTAATPSIHHALSMAMKIRAINDSRARIRSASFPVNVHGSPSLALRLQQGAPSKLMVCDRDPAVFDHALPAAPFKSGYSTTFTLTQLTRALVLDSKAYQLKTGDGIDYCHAIIAASFARAATLDKAWKRRIEALPSRTISRRSTTGQNWISLLTISRLP